MKAEIILQTSPLTQTNPWWLSAGGAHPFVLTSETQGVIFLKQIINEAQYLFVKWEQSCFSLTSLRARGDDWERWELCNCAPPPLQSYNHGCIHAGATCSDLSPTATKRQSAPWHRHSFSELHSITLVLLCYTVTYRWSTLLKDNTIKHSSN